MMQDVIIKLRKLNLGKGLLPSLMLVITVTAAVGMMQNAQAAPGLDDNQALQISLSYLQEHASEWGIQSANDEFRLRSIFRDQLDQIHVRLDQVYRGVPVFGKQLIVHLNGDGTPRSVTGVYKEGITISTVPRLAGQEAREKALKHFPGPFTNLESELVLYPQDSGVVLTYRVAIHDDETPRRIVDFVDAATGERVYSYNDLRTLMPSAQESAQVQNPTAKPASSVIALTSSPATGIGKSLYSGTVGITTNKDSSSSFSMHDFNRGDIRTSDMKNRFWGSGAIFTDSDNTWGDFTTKDRATAGVDAHFGAEMTWDYYKNNHIRNGIYNDSKGSLSRVHYWIKYNNAFWDDSCRCMTYGDGDGTTFSPLVSLDVAGHEMTHGVTSATAGLIYSGESGGLNEAISDIFGTLVEYYASTHGATTGPDYWIGEDVYTPLKTGDALRYMDTPTRDGRSIDYYGNYYSGLDVHYSSGIANNAFYLLAVGGTHRLGGVVTGIGQSAADQIFYRALTVYMIPSETFHDARIHTVQAATDLYGTTNPEYIQSVNQTWDAVGVT